LHKRLEVTIMEVKNLGSLFFLSALWGGSFPRLQGRWRTYLVIGAINSAVPFVLISTATLYLPVSLAATLNATTPLFGAVAAAIWMGETLTLILGSVTLVSLRGLPAQNRLEVKPLG
jgi:drug/metabolite transporter (DMT)-like permease